ncbi:MAG: aldo/keto reductase [Alphaproteobacteria bacterium]
MEKGQLGKTGIWVSPIGLGTIKFGRNEGVKYPSGFEIPGEMELAALLSFAKELGINLLDTAPSYGLSEERLGRLLKGQRKDWVIVGKAGEDFADGKSSYDFTPAHFEHSLEQSLEKLQTDYLDVLLVHSDGCDVEILTEELIAKLQDFKKRGLVKAIGASTKTVAGGLKAVEQLDAAMMTYNSQATEEKPVLDKALELSKGIILKKSLMSGHAGNIEEAMKFAFLHPAVSCVITGTINPDHLQENARAALKALA